MCLFESVYLMVVSLSHQPQYSSTPAGAGDGLSTQQLPPPQQPQRGRHVLGPLGSQENIAKQQVVFRGGKKTLLSLLVEHAQLAGSGAGAGVSPSDRRESLCSPYDVGVHFRRQEGTLAPPQLRVFPLKVMHIYSILPSPISPLLKFQLLEILFWDSHTH